MPLSSSLFVCLTTCTVSYPWMYYYLPNLSFSSYHVSAPFEHWQLIVNPDHHQICRDHLQHNHKLLKHKYETLLVKLDSLKNIPPSTIQSSFCLSITLFEYSVSSIVSNTFSTFSTSYLFLTPFSFKFFNLVNAAKRPPLSHFCLFDLLSPSARNKCIK